MIQNIGNSRWISDIEVSINIVCIASLDVALIEHTFYKNITGKPHDLGGMPESFASRDA